MTTPPRKLSRTPRPRPRPDRGRGRDRDRGRVGPPEGPGAGQLSPRLSAAGAGADSGGRAAPLRASVLRAGRPVAARLSPARPATLRDLPGAQPRRQIRRLPVPPALSDSAVSSAGWRATLRAGTPRGGGAGVGGAAGDPRPAPTGLGEAGGATRPPRTGRHTQTVHGRLQVLLAVRLGAE